LQNYVKYNNLHNAIYLLIYNIMENTILVAKILWPVFIIIWLSIILNKKFYQKMIEKINEEILWLYFAWLFWLVIWLLILNVNNKFWDAKEIIITLTWFIITIKSATVLIYPKLVKNMAKSFSSKITLINIVAIFEIIIWLYLTLNSYIK
jgi:hypothetical protein